MKNRRHINSITSDRLYQGWGLNFWNRKHSDRRYWKTHKVFGVIQQKRSA